MKSLLAIVLMCISTASFAKLFYNADVTCENPWAFSEHHYSSQEVDKVMVTNDGTYVELKNGKELMFGPAIKCIIEKKGE